MILPKVDIKRILYATDLSDNARHAFAYAVSLANLYGAAITLLHVLAEVPESLDRGVLGYISADRWEEIKNRQVHEAKQILTRKKREYVPIREVLDQFCEDVKSSHANQNFVADEILVIKGHPDDEILIQAEKRNCDLIVMGTHGHGIIEETLVGSTARRVIRRSKKPVLVVRLPEED
ncbi:MAG: universal stress protein [Deltaproteobacteria bacterium]|nr:universal stress protein [Deltaproteobacteria bacterium]